MVEKSATLILDDASRKLTVESKQQPLAVAYDEIRKVIFDPRYHLCYLESGKSGGDVRLYMLRVGEGSWDEVTAKVKESLGDLVQVADLRNGEKIDKSTLKDLQSSHSLKVGKV